MSLVTPLNRVLGLGSAKDGTEHWWGQRLSAVALAFLGSWLAIALFGVDDWSYASLVLVIGSPINSVLMILTVLTLCYHSQLGVQVVVEDYVHGSALKIAMLVAATFGHTVLAVAGVFAVLKLAFGAPA